MAAEAATPLGRAAKPAEPSTAWFSGVAIVPPDNLFDALDESRSLIL
jgi:hypothetical protein